ncbi:hypothetical protein R3P38DRAFT_3241989 [Favolaschia claudopus]|uniref:Uncharacterized protein n=1 Tax=Favolaschia claudopus TaxID=2862362 RepID=A0AAV9Z558_9AGAR
MHVFHISTRRCPICTSRRRDCALLSSFHHISSFAIDFLPHPDDHLPSNPHPRSPRVDSSAARDSVIPSPFPFLAPALDLALASPRHAPRYASTT